MGVTIRNFVRKLELGKLTILNLIREVENTMHLFGRNDKYYYVRWNTVSGMIEIGEQIMSIFSEPKQGLVYYCKDTTNRIERVSRAFEDALSDFEHDKLLDDLDSL